jgi:hypothetical protein
MRVGRTGGILLLLTGLCPAAAGCCKSPVPVEGLIVTAAGKPVWGVAVRFWNKDRGRQPFTAITDPEGRFQLDCPAGDYQVTVLPPSAKGTGRGTGVGPLPSGGTAEGPGAKVQPPVPKIYWRTETTPLRVTVPAAKELILAIQDEAETPHPEPPAK